MYSRASAKPKALPGLRTLPCSQSAAHSDERRPALSACSVCSFAGPHQSFRSCPGNRIFQRTLGWDTPTDELSPGLSEPFTTFNLTCRNAGAGPPGKANKGGDNGAQNTDAQTTGFDHWQTNA